MDVTNDLYFDLDGDEIEQELVVDAVQRGHLIDLKCETFVDLSDQNSILDALAELNYDAD